MAAEIWTVKRLLAWTEDFLRKKEIEPARLEAQILLAHALGCKKIDLYVRHDEEPAEAVRTRFREIIKKRAEGMPNAYLVGRKEFFSLEFKVTPAVLIPRPETELLVVEAAKFLKPLNAPAVLDIGAGSGCISIALAKQHRTARVTAIDISPAALEVAKENAATHQLTDRVRFLEGSVFGPVAGETFDLIASNPPYITHAELETLDKTVKDYEPRSALDGGPDGLTFYRQIASGATAHLRSGGLLIVEIGYQQETAVRELFAAEAGLENVKSFKDIDGHPRVVTANRKK
ncbi:peptide chain release factor N(5)-glutamine methyltransferase [Zavarzinella formosa]|uniref:peptide chain release factor N(5)-glutamine methyltransferase n=1 Tax=Zavarzinella formosa TaxID=360055 RepID=UPI0002D4676E|nr:peptide chain release factor N(5)-glutamine methyltransferase [Zavarzinella formosa]